MHKLSKTDRFSYRLRLHKFERIRFLLFTRDIYGYLIVSDLCQMKQSFLNLLIIYEEIFNQYLEIGENYSQILQTLILTFSQNMDEFEKQVQTLENVHHLISKFQLSFHIYKYERYTYMVRCPVPVNVLFRLQYKQPLTPFWLNYYFSTWGNYAFITIEFDYHR